jgi:uncharacterized phage protein gp47/JayE
MPVYGEKEKSDILVNVLNSLERNAGISASHPGSIARAFAEAFSTEIADLYSSLNFTIRQGALSTASGRNLDLIGELYGVSRKQISDAAALERQSFNIEFFIDNPYSQNITIPGNTFLYTDVESYAIRQYRFKLNGDITIAAGTTRAYGLAVPDFDDNTYVAATGSITQHNFIAPPGVVAYCMNTKEIYSAINSESDDNFRRRIISSIKTRAAGTTESIRFAALSVKGVRDVRIRESSYGIGSCDVIVVPESLSGIKRMPDIILSAIASVKPAGVRFNIRIAEQIPIDVQVSITVASAANGTIEAGIKNQAALFVKRYLNSLTIGDTVSVGEIERQVRLSSDFIRYVTINALSANGESISIKDFTPSSDKVYPGAGSVSVLSVIMGQSNY